MAHRRARGKSTLSQKEGRLNLNPETESGRRQQDGTRSPKRQKRIQITSRSTRNKHSQGVKVPSPDDAPAELIIPGSDRSTIRMEPFHDNSHLEEQRRAAFSALQSLGLQVDVIIRLLGAPGVRSSMPGTMSAASDQTIMEFYATKYAPLRMLGKSYGAKQEYLGALRWLDRFMGRAALLTDLNDDNVAKFMDWYSDSGKRSNATVNKAARHLLAIWRFARKTKVVTEEPSFDKLPEVRRVKPAWTVFEVGQLLEMCDTQSGWVWKIAAAKFWRAIVLTLFDTGARKGALLNTKYDDFSAEKRTIFLRGELQKQRQDQIVALSTETVEAIEAMGCAGRTLLFPWMHDRFEGGSWRLFNYHFRLIVQKAGLDSKYGLAQRLRRTRATYGEIVMPGSACADLGHSDPRVTTGHYIDRSMLGGSPVVDKLPRPVPPVKAPVATKRKLSREVDLSDVDLSEFF